MTIKFICKQCGKEYYKPDCFKNIKTSFCCKECRNSYSRHKHITFKQNEFIIKDGYCLLNNYFKIDIEDIQKIKELNCYISKMSNGYGCFIKNKKHFLFHRWLVNCPSDKVVDHYNRDITDNRKQNLNIVTMSQNMQNRKIQSNNKTGHIGIHRTNSGYRAYIKVGDKEFKKHFPILEKAIQWRNRMEQELNFYRGGV